LKCFFSTKEVRRHRCARILISMVDLASVPALVLEDLVAAANEDLVDSNLPVEDPPLVPPPSDDSDWTSSPAGKEFRSSFLFQSSCYLPGDDDATESETSYSHALSPPQRQEFLFRPASRSQTFSSESSSAHSSLRKPKDALSPISDERRHVAFSDEMIDENDDKEEKAYDDDTECGESSLSYRGFRIIVPLHHAFGPLPPAPLTQYTEESYTATSVWKEDDGGVQSRTGVSALSYNNESIWPVPKFSFPKFRRKQLVCICSLVLFLSGLLIIAVSCGKRGCRRSEAATTPSPAMSPPFSSSLDAAPTLAPDLGSPATMVLRTTPELYDAVDLYLLQRFGAMNRSREERLLEDEEIVPIGLWDVRDIYNFTSVFDVRRNRFAAQFNEDLHLWDVSNGITMESMFYGAEEFNGDISTWNTSNVINMKDMFALALKFSGNLSFWDVSKVTTMEGTCKWNNQPFM
jgi:surface protein